MHCSVPLLTSDDVNSLAESRHLPFSRRSVGDRRSRQPHLSAAQRRLKENVCEDDRGETDVGRVLLSLHQLLSLPAAVEVKTGFDFKDLFHISHHITEKHSAAAVIISDV